MKIVITGGNGFIGRNLAEYLTNKGYYVKTLDINDIDLLDTKSVDDFFKENKFDALVHAAVIGGNRKIQNSSDTVKNNLMMFFNLEKNKDSYKRMIFFGSGAEFDKSSDIKDVKEEEFGKKIPIDEYGFFKYIITKYIEQSKDIINLRIFGVFGKYEDYETRLVSNIICRVIFNLPIEIKQNAVFDYISIEDLCKITEFFIINKPKEKCYNLGAEKHLDFLEIINIIKKVSKKDFNIIIKNSGMNKEYSGNNSRLLNELKGFKFIDMEGSISELYQWYVNNKDKIKKDSLLLY
jgi:UDP-glucose 4-epimerase